MKKLDLILTKIIQEWALEKQASVILQFSYENKINFINFYDLINEFFTNKQDQISWINQSKFNYENLIQSVIKEPEALVAVNQQIERLMNP